MNPAIDTDHAALTADTDHAALTADTAVRIARRDSLECC